MPEPIDHLRNLIDSPGWALFVRHASEQWSDSFVLQRMKAQMQGQTPMEDDESARSLLVAQSAVLQLLAWPQNEAEKLSANQTPKGADTPVGWFKRQVGRS